MLRDFRLVGPSRKQQDDNTVHLVPQHRHEQWRPASTTVTPRTRPTAAHANRRLTRSGACAVVAVTVLRDVAADRVAAAAAVAMHPPTVSKRLGPACNVTPVSTSASPSRKHTKPEALAYAPQLLHPRKSYRRYRTARPTLPSARAAVGHSTTIASSAYAIGGGGRLRDFVGCRGVCTDVTCCMSQQVFEPHAGRAEPLDAYKEQGVNAAHKRVAGGGKPAGESRSLPAHHSYHHHDQRQQQHAGEDVKPCEYSTLHTCYEKCIMSCNVECVFWMLLFLGCRLRSI